MSPAQVRAIVFDGPLSSATVVTNRDFGETLGMQHDGYVGDAVPLARNAGARRTPRKSLIVVLPENHVVSPDLLAEHLSAESDKEEVDVILACAGQPTSIAALQRRVRRLQVLLAPAGTSCEDLREFAMNRAPGDIVTLVSGAPA